MANTSRKRPQPSSAMAAANGNGTTAAATLNGPLPAGIDALLAKYARHLPPGGSVTVRLVKGPTSSSVDPIAARQAAKKAARAKAAAAAAAASSGASSGNDSDGNANGNGAAAGKNGAAVPLTFPRMAKFIETVSPPDFSGGLKDGRMYEEEVPKAKDESDEEDSTAYRSSNADASAEGADPNNPSISEASSKNKKKKRRWRRNDPRPRRWVLQEKEEFFDRIRKRRQRASSGGAAGDDDEQGISNQYHGVVESNASKYIILSVAPPSGDGAPPVFSSPSSATAAEQISIQPIAGFHTFSQPHKHAALTMEEAENAIEKQRNVVTRYMMHGKLASQNNSSEAKAALASGVASVGGRGRGRGLSRSLGPAPKAMSRARLLGKLAGGGGVDEDEDDVMGDVRFSSSKGGGSKARKELLTSLGDDITADDDGVIGGANDSEFGGRRRFARVAVGKDDGDTPNKKESKAGKGGTTSTGFEAGAMEEGFYQRDVAAEYEALDYDANEQFDDDDVNVGEDEMDDTGGGFGGGDYDSDDDGLLESDDGEVSDDDDFQGMASASGLKAMLARARGESPQTAGADSNAAVGTGADDSAKGPDGKGADASDTGKGGKGIDKMLESAKNISKQMEINKPDPTASTEEKKSPEKPGAGPASSSPKTVDEILYDKDGKRLITLEAVRREIWLNNGAITSKRLTKKFDVNKKNPERQALFKTIVMELCTIKKDADGNKLVLKQHYSKI